MGSKCKTGSTGTSKGPELVLWKLPMKRGGRGPKIMADLATGSSERVSLSPCRTVADSPPPPPLEIGDAERVVLSEVRNHHVHPLSPGPLMAHDGYLSIPQTYRNKARLKDYQWEYSCEVRAPGCRKVSRMQRQLLEADHRQKCRLLEREGLRPSSKAAISPCVSLLSPS
jgi:hypothetical protein